MTRTKLPMLKDHRHAFDALVADGMEPAAAGLTYEFCCRRCGVQTFLGPHGGTFSHGGCEPNCDGADIDIYPMLAGERWHMGTIADVAAATGHPTSENPNAHAAHHDDTHTR
jgi:hypothetical protein